MPVCLRSLFCSILISGIVIVLFYQCMSVLCDPVNHTRENVKWGLVAYTVAAFSFVTIFTATNLYIQSISYIGNREFLGVTGISTSGPLGYQLLTHSKMVSICRNLTFLLNNWLAEGLLVSFVSNSVIQVLYSTCLVAISLPRSLLHGLPGHCLPMLDVPRLSGCVLELSISRRRLSQLTSLM